MTPSASGSADTGLSSGEVAAIAATATGVPVLCIIIFGALWWRHKRRQTKSSDPDQGPSPDLTRVITRAEPLVRPMAQTSRVQSYTDTHTTSSGSSPGIGPVVTPAREFVPGPYFGAAPQDHGPGNLYRDYSDPAIVRLEPSRENIAAQRYQLKLQRELDINNQETSTGAGTSYGTQRAEGSGVNPHQMNDGMRAGVERLGHLSNAGLTSPPPDYRR
jgi:hypothetical protein